MNALHPILTVQQLAQALGGDVVAQNQVLAPGPGHSGKDRSMSVWLDPQDPAGFKVHSHAGDDVMDCRDYVRQRLGLEPFPSHATNNTAKPPRLWVAEYIYRQEDGTPYLRVTRWAEAGKKTFTQSHWTGSSWTGGKPKGPKLPYRLPELLAEPTAPVFICEGEKHADALAKLGFVATSGSEGAEKWTPDLNRWFVGREVFVLPDNDRVGEKHGQEVAQFLHGVAHQVRVVRLPGLPDKGDVLNWLDAGGNPEELLALAHAAPLWAPGGANSDGTEVGTETEHNASAVPFITAAELLSRPLKPRRFLAGQTMPLGQVTDFRGDGKTGKSTLGIQLCVAAVTGRPWLGMPVVRGPAIYLASEDDVDEVHRRIEAIAAHYGVPNDALSDLHVWPLAEDDPALVILEGGKLKSTQRWRELEAKIEAVRPVLVVLDSRADVFAGEEMNRQQVRTFVGMLRALAVKTGACLVLLSHPSLSGMSDRTGNSGSTHWTNAVRSVLYLHRPEGDAGDPDARELTFGPSNYAAGGAAPLQLRWSAGAFVAEGGPPRSTSQQQAEAEADQVFLDLLALYKARGMHVCATPGNNYAPKLFEREKAAARLKSKGLRAAMFRLLDAGKIRTVEEGPPSRRHKYLVLVERG